MLRFSPLIYLQNFRSTLLPKLEFAKVLGELSKDGQDKPAHPSKFDRSIWKAVELAVSLDNLDKE